MKKRMERNNLTFCENIYGSGIHIRGYYKMVTQYKNDVKKYF